MSTKEIPTLRPDQITIHPLKLEDRTVGAEIVGTEPVPDQASLMTFVRFRLIEEDIPDYRVFVVAVFNEDTTYFLNCGGLGGHIIGLRPPGRKTLWAEVE